MTSWFQYGYSQGFKWSRSNLRGHSGIDLAVPYNTQVTAILPGRVLFASCTPWGGQVDILASWQGGSVVYTVLHLHQISIGAGATVSPGQLLGYSGGDARGPCPTGAQYSRGPHVHFELTSGTLGPYHGGAPRNYSASNHTLDPAGLLTYARTGGKETISNSSGTSGIGAQETVFFPALDVLFALPDATTEALDAIPGVDNLIYRLHDAETLPGWKTLDQVAPLSTISTPAGTFTNPLDAVNPGRVAYWLVGNLLGNLRAVVVRSIFVIAGFILLMGLMIALGSAQENENFDREAAVASKVAEVVAPAVTAA